MGMATILKLLALLLWPLLLLALYYFCDKKGFMRRFDNLRRGGGRDKN